MSFPRYANYKDSGVEWLGEVPKHWKTAKIKHLISTFEQGWSPQCEGFPVESEHQWGVLKVGCVNGGTFKPEENKTLPSELEPIPTLAILKDDLLISRANTRELVGSAAIAKRDYPNLLLCDKLYRLRFLQDTCSPVFIALHLGTNGARGQIELAATGASSSMVNIAQSTILELNIVVPDLLEQKSIVAFLDAEIAKIDALVAEQRRLMELLKEKRQAVISHAVTKGLDPDAPMKPSGIEWLADVPAHWDLTPLKYVVNLRSGGTPSKANLTYWDGDVPWASSKDLKSEVLSDTQDHITQSAIDEGAAVLVPAGSLLIVVRGMILIHTFPVVKALVPMAINQDLKALTPSHLLDVDFLAWLLRGASKETLGRIDEAAHGTKVLRLDTWTSIVLPIPPIAEQIKIVDEIVNRLNQIDTLATEIQRAIDLLQERRTALISAAVTGQIDVRKFAVNESAPCH